MKKGFSYLKLYKLRIHLHDAYNQGDENKVYEISRKIDEMQLQMFKNR